MLGVALLIVAAAIVGSAVAVARGRGGEMAMFPRATPAALALRTPRDVIALRLPLAFIGYQPEATAAVLNQVARLLAERDAEITRLRAGSDPSLRGDTSGPSVRPDPPDPPWQAS